MVLTQHEVVSVVRRCMRSQGLTKAIKKVCHRMSSVASERNFLALLAEQGYSSETIKDELISMGWHPQSASLVLQRFAEGTTFEPAPVPLGPDLGQLPTRIDAGDREISILASMRQPRMCLLGNFLSTQECAELIELSAPLMERSKVIVSDGDAKHETSLTYARTSDQTSIPSGTSKLVDAIRRRAARVTRWPEAQMQDLLIVRYRPGADFSPHHDYFCPKSHPYLALHGQRVGTLLFYLNTPPRGGATALLDVEMEVYPQQGNALFFSYPLPRQDSLTLHAGVPLGEGEKWVATFFLTAEIAKKNKHTADEGNA